MNKNKLFKLALSGIYAAFATITFMLENLFPPIILPGARMGLSNVFILLSATTLGGIYGYATLIVKVVLGSLFAGNISAVMYSLPAGIIALSIELLIIFYAKKTSLVCASVCGAIVNVTIQNAVFCLVTDAGEYLVFLPYLSLVGVFSGLIVGLSVYLILKKIPTKLFVDKE